MAPRVVIDCFPASVSHYVADHTIVAVDVIRATTTAVTGVALGRRCFAAASLESAFQIAGTLQNPLMIGELGGTLPPGFDMNNSPAELAEREDIHRPAVLLSSSGTRLIVNAASARKVYIACLRNAAATARAVAHSRQPVAIIGAGTGGEFREEDQLCCAWIARDVVATGYIAGRATLEIVDRWGAAPAEAAAQGNSAAYLKRSHQLRDLEFILNHVNDLDSVFRAHGSEAILMPAAEAVAVSAYAH